jgi:putative DNA primase/helicase
MNAASLARALHAVRSGRQWKCKCVVHEDRSPSMIIFDGRENVQVRCLAGCDQRDLIAELRRRGLWGDTERREETRKHNPDVSHETTRMRDLARALFEQSVLCVGTMAQKYLESRELWSAARDLEDIRFYAHCPRGVLRQPALVIAMRSVSSHAITAVQRIYLSQSGHKDGAMMLGPAGGSAMMLGWSAGTLHITEGLESALAVMCMDQAPVWAMGSCGAIERLPVLDGVDRLVIWADNDAPGLRAADACAVRWAKAGIEVVLRIPLEEGSDPADIWRDRCARQ